MFISDGFFGFPEKECKNHPHSTESMGQVNSVEGVKLKVPLSGLLITAKLVLR